MQRRSVDELHRDSIIIDTHCDTLSRVLEGRRRLGERSTEGQFDLPEPLLEGIAATGGVVGVTPVPKFLGEDAMHTDLSMFLDHVDHMVQVMGEDGVGLGMDFDGMGDMRTTGIEDISHLPNITQELARRGYSAKAIGQILGGNFLRVFQQVFP